MKEGIGLDRMMVSKSKERKKKMRRKKLENKTSRKLGEKNWI